MLALLKPVGRGRLGTMLGTDTSVSRYLCKPSFCSASQYKQQNPSHVSHRGSPVDGMLCTASLWEQHNEPSSWKQSQTLQMAAKQRLKCPLCNSCCQEVPGWGRLEMLLSTQEGRAGLMRQSSWEIQMNVQDTAHGVWLVKDPTSNHGKCIGFCLLLQLDFFAPRTHRESSLYNVKSVLFVDFFLLLLWFRQIFGLE